MKDIVKSSEIISQKFINTLFNFFMFGKFYRIPLGNWTSSDVYYDFYPWIFDAQPIRFEFQNTLLAKDILDDKRVRIQQKEFLRIIEIWKAYTLQILGLMK